MQVFKMFVTIGITLALKKSVLKHIKPSSTDKCDRGIIKRKKLTAMGY